MKRRLPRKQKKLIKKNSSIKVLDKDSLKAIDLSLNKNKKI